VPTRHCVLVISNQTQNMKKIFFAVLLSIAALLNKKQASAQFAYNFTKATQAYTPLTGATSISGNTRWTADTTFAIPVGFNVKLAGVTTNKVYLSAGNFVFATIGTAKQNGFLMMGTGLADRGKNWSTPLSDVRYTTTGTAGSRIFKLEVFNAGFDDEYLNYGEMKDSISLQLWLFEGSNVVEFHYGTSQVNNFSDYFGPAMMCGYIKNGDTATGAFEKFYVLKGTSSAPTLDSMTSITQAKGLSNVPTAGTVFRFTPKGSSATGVGNEPYAPLAKIYPTVFANSLTIEHSNTRPISYMLINASGIVVSQGSVSNGKSGLDVSNLAAGTYTIRLADEAATTYEGQRLIKL
jgi:hypothetical protein